MKAISLVLATACVMTLAGCGAEDDPSKLTCNDLGRVKDEAVLAKMKQKCGIGTGVFEYSKPRSWNP